LNGYSSAFDYEKSDKKIDGRSPGKILSLDLKAEVKEEPVYLDFNDFCQIDFGL
jgi:hypothetical protein